MRRDNLHFLDALTDRKEQEYIFKSDSSCMLEGPPQIGGMDTEQGFEPECAPEQMEREARPVPLIPDLQFSELRLMYWVHAEQKPCMKTNGLTAKTLVPGHAAVPDRKRAVFSARTMLGCLRLLLLTVVVGIGTLLASDQTGAEGKKQPISAEILTTAAKADETPIGNVQVTYEDGTKDLWTTKGNCSLASVGPGGIVGWTVNGPEIPVNSADTMRPNGTLVLCRKGKVLASIRSGKAFIEKWDFYADGRQLVLVTRGSHGPADVELHDATTGKLIASVQAFADNLPAWARPYAD